MMLVLAMVVVVEHARVVGMVSVHVVRIAVSILLIIKKFLSRLLKL